MKPFRVFFLVFFLLLTQVACDGSYPPYNDQFLRNASLQVKELLGIKHERYLPLVETHLEIQNIQNQLRSLFEERGGERDWVAVLEEIDQRLEVRLQNLKSLQFSLYHSRDDRPFLNPNYQPGTPEADSWIYLTQKLIHEQFLVLAHQAWVQGILYQVNHSFHRSTPNHRLESISSQLLDLLPHLHKFPELLALKRELDLKLLLFASLPTGEFLSSPPPIPWLTRISITLPEDSVQRLDTLKLLVEEFLVDQRKPALLARWVLLQRTVYALALHNELRRLAAQEGTTLRGDLGFLRQFHCLLLGEKLLREALPSLSQLYQSHVTYLEGSRTDHSAETSQWKRIEEGIQSFIQADHATLIQTHLEFESRKIDPYQNHSIRREWNAVESLWASLPESLFL